MVVSSSVSRPPLFFLAIWVLYILATPFYPFGQGAAQPSTYLLALFGFPALAMAAMKWDDRINPVILYGTLFAALTLTINLLHYAFLPDIRFLLSAVYYLFNIGLLFYVILLFRVAPDNMKRITYTALAISLLAQVFFIAFWNNEDGGRAIGTFTNPNQLAYWCLLTLMMIALLKQDERFTLRDFFLFGCGLYIQACALSKAGIITTSLFMLALVFLPSMKTGSRAIIFCLVCMAAIFMLFDQGRVQSGLEQSSVLERLSTLGAERDDSAEGRGYMRIMEEPYYLLFGAGEGGFKRFDGPTMELHSGLATLIFSYGVTGLILFGALLWSLFHQLPRHIIALLGIVLLFSFVHQSLRFPFFWMFIGVCYAARPVSDLAHDQRCIGAAEPERVG